ncbi:hypothetical protein C4Q26_15635 [Pseudomonas sp. SWI44]|nr:hypothetical protein C4Q26_15635 [Pseudomonas sp. SWI44]
MVNLAHALGAPCTTAGAFFVPAVLCNGGCVWAGFGLAGFPKFPGIPTPYTAATQSRRKDRGSSNQNLESHACPPKIR